MSKDMGASVPDQALAVPAEPVSAVSALTGFDPSRKRDAFQIQLDALKRRNAFDSAADAARALQWLDEYGLRVLNGSDFGSDFTGSEEAASYLKAAKEAFAGKIIEYALGKARCDIRYAYASAIEAATAGETGNTGSTEGESAAPSGETPK